MSTPPLEVKIAGFASIVDCWLDVHECALVLEFGDGDRINIKLSPSQFEAQKDKGMRVYDREKGRCD